MEAGGKEDTLWICRTAAREVPRMVRRAKNIVKMGAQLQRNKRCNCFEGLVFAFG